MALRSLLFVEFTFWVNPQWLGGGVSDLVDVGSSTASGIIIKDHS